MKKVALITGGAQGIGRALCLRLAKDGFNIAICDLERQKEKVLDIINEMKSFDCKSVFIPTDVRKKQQVENAVDQAFQELGSFDVMINNAGICIVNSLLQAIA